MIKSNKIILRKNLIFSLLFSFIGGFVFGQAHEASSAPEQHDVEHPAGEGEGHHEFDPAATALR